MTQPLNDANAEELAQPPAPRRSAPRCGAGVAQETGALVLRGWLRYPGPESGDWQVGDEILSEFLYPFRERQVALILAPVGGEPIHLCGICGFVLEEPGQDCPRCALSNERDGAAIRERQDVVAGVERWLADQRPEPHPLEVELARLQAVLEALDECPPSGEIG